MKHSQTTCELRVYKSAEGNDICQLASPITFYCTLGEQEMKVQITHAEENGTTWMYHLQFADGYKGVFAPGKQHNLFLENGQTFQNTYAKAVNEDLLIIYQFNPLRPPFHLLVNVKGDEKSVWVTQENGCYAVFFDGDLRFFFYNYAGRWQAETIDLPKSYIVPEIKEAVLLHLGQGSLN